MEDDMVNFFGIFDPGRFKRRAADEAPGKANFFGGAGPELAWGLVPLSRAEVEACYLAVKAPEPDEIASRNDREPV